MKALRLLHFLALFIIAQFAMAQQPSLPPETTLEKAGWKREPFKKVGDVELNVWILTPEGHLPETPRPGVVFYYGGGWNGRSMRHFQPQGEYLVSRGMVAVLPDYRAKSAYGGSPFDCVEDAKSAMRWVRANAKRLGIDPNRIAAGGGSAGGHLAAATATVPGLNAPTDDLSVNCVPNALLLFNPVYDNGPDGYGYERVKERYEEISPFHNIRKGAPPTIVFLGDKDKLIPVATAEAYEAKMKEVGSRCETHIYPGRAHGFFNLREDAVDYTDTVIKMDRFLASLGYLEGEPTLKAKE